MSLMTYGPSSKLFQFGNIEFNYRYRIPVIQNKGPNYNSGYVDGYQRALRDLQKNINRMQENKGRMEVSFYNY